jgi:hypothetical protein
MPHGEPQVDSPLFGNPQFADWQFWVVTAVALAAVLFIARPLWTPLLGLGRKKSANCPGCPNGDAAGKPPRPKHVDLTIGGKRVKR